MQDIIGVVFDFDDTLAPDTTWGFLEWWGEDPPAFWRKSVDPLLEEGWDPIPAYLYALIRASNSRPPWERITRESLARYGRGVKVLEGATRIFDKLRAHARAENPEVALEFYVISSGIRSLLEHTRISRHFTRIWACDFHFDPASGEIVFPKNVISFTDKTRYLFQISKGLAGTEYDNQPFAVNRRVPSDRMRIPMNRMIYVGDGLTDIPCFSLIRKNQGVAIGVYDPERREKWKRAWGFIEDGRVSNLVPADYGKNSALEISLRMAISRMATDIGLRKRTYQE